MFDDDDFVDLMERTRAGDSAAAAELGQRYEPLVRRAVRAKITDQRLNRVFDSMDIC